MPAVYSNEGKIETRLRKIQCSGRNFIKVAKVLGISISDGKFSEALNDKGRLDTSVGQRLLDLLAEMSELQTVVNAPIDWSDTEHVREQLAQRRLFKQAVKYDSDGVRRLLGNADGTE